MAMFRWLYLVLAINIRAGVHIAVTPRFPHQNYVVVRLSLIHISTHIAGEITVTGNKYVVGVRNMLSPADFGPKLLEVIKEHFPQDVK